MSRRMGLQKYLVLQHLKHRGSITTFIAFKRYAITRLSERIRELEADGYVIRHPRVTRNGKTYVAYSLIESVARAA